jgi:hypothetical protein
MGKIREIRKIRENKDLRFLYLVVGGSESSFDVFIIKNLDFKSKVLLQLKIKIRNVFNDHD